MTDLIRFILHHETSCRAAGGILEEAFERARLTGFGEHPNDTGGATMCGVTLRTYTDFVRKNRIVLDGKAPGSDPSKADLKNIPFDHWLRIFTENFWNRCRASEINVRPLAWMIVDWVWHSGPKVLKRIQKILGVKADGIVGPVTVAAVNAADPALLFERLHKSRVSYVSECCAARPANRVFRTGWLRRISHIHFSHLEYL